MSKQRLSASAAKAKAVRDLEYANSPARERKRADNQRFRRSAIKAGRDIRGKDYDHNDRRFESVSANRGNDGKGTKSEG